MSEFNFNDLKLINNVNKLFLFLTLSGVRNYISDFTIGEGKEKGDNQ